MMSGLTVEPLDENTTDPCDCCGHVSRAVWGMIHDGLGPLASYAVHWTPTHIADQGAVFDLVLGEWGEESIAEERVAVSVMMRHQTEGASFMVGDAEGRPLAQNMLAGRALAREQVIGTGIAQEVFACLDAIWLQDERIREVTQPPVRS